MAADAVLRRRWRHLLEPLQLLGRHFLRLVRQRGLLDPLTQDADLARVRVGLAQLALDRPHLFPQEEIALRLRDGSRHVALNLGAQREHLVLAVEHRQQPRQPLLDQAGFKQPLPLLQAQVEIDRDQVREVPRVLGVERRNLDLLGQRWRKLDNLLELALRVAHHRRQLHGIFLLVPHQLELGAQIRLGCGVFLQPDPPKPLHQHAHRVVRKLEHLEHARRAADLVHLVRQRILRFRVALQHQAQQTVPAHHVVNELDALRGLHQQRRHHSWENHNIRQPQDRQDLRQGAGRDARGRLRAAGSSEDADKFRIGRRHH